MSDHSRFPSMQQQWLIGVTSRLLQLSVMPPHLLPFHHHQLAVIIGSDWTDNVPAAN